MKHFNLSGWAVSHPALILFLVVALGAAGFFSYQKLGRAEDPFFTVKVVNVSGESQETELNFAGMGEATPLRIRATVLSGKPEDENTLDQPTKVSPAEHDLMFAKPAFTHRFPRHSVTVMRVRSAEQLTR